MTNPRPLDARSAAALVRIARLPRFVLVIAIAAVFAGGLFLPGLLGAVLLVAIAALVGWLARLTWSTHPPTTRLMRVLVVAALLGGAIAKLW